MANKKDKATSSDAGSAQPAELQLVDPTVEAHLPAMRETAASEGRQRKILASGRHDDGTVGNTVLIVEKDGSHRVVFEAE